MPPTSPSEEAPSDKAPSDDAPTFTAVETFYHAWLTGLILTLVTRAGTPEAAEIVFRAFRRQQQTRFLPGLRKLGLLDLPHAVACARYHYLSNQVGGGSCLSLKK